MANGQLCYLRKRCSSFKESQADVKFSGALKSPLIRLLVFIFIERRGAVELCKFQIFLAGSNTMKY